MNSPISDLILVNLDAPCHAKLPMHRRIFEIVRRAILDRSIQAGTKMPSTRSLSVEFGCARNTILQAFEQLRAEGASHPDGHVDVEINRHTLEIMPKGTYCQHDPHRGIRLNRRRTPDQ